jgi:sugar phosphate isomerase/epimerase
VVNDVDALIHWLGPGNPGGLSGPSEAELFTAGEALGASFVNVVFASAGPVALGLAVEAFAGIAARAAEHGLRAHLEFVPFMTVPDARQALCIVEGAGRPECGLMVDSWHCFRGPTSFADLRALPGDRVLGLQVNDAPSEPMPDPVVETLHHRLVPGEGAIDLVGWLGSLRAAGCRAPLTVEVFSDRLLAEHSPVEAAMRLGDAIRALRARV